MRAAAPTAEVDEGRARACLLTTCGLPGAGKSTLARAVAERAESDGIHVTLVSFDDIERRLALEKTSASASRADAAGDLPSTGDFDADAWKAARVEALAAVARLLETDDDGPRKLVIADDNFYYAGMRQKCHRVARRARAAHVQLFVDISLEQAHARNEAREPHAVVPREALRRMADRFEPPSGDSLDPETSALDSKTEIPERRRAFERDSVVVVDAATLAECGVGGRDSSSSERDESARARWRADVDRIWRAVETKWNGPAALGGFSAEAVDERRNRGAAANAASAVHGLDTRSRKVLANAMTEAVRPANGRVSMSTRALGEFSKRLNEKRREMMAAARAIAVASKRPNWNPVCGDHRRDELGAFDEDAEDDAFDAELGFVAEMNALESRFVEACRIAVSGE
jgi:O-phosphoseryl-tRNA(Sec) kinase